MAGFHQVVVAIRAMGRERFPQLLDATHHRIVKGVTGHVAKAVVVFQAEPALGRAGRQRGGSVDQQRLDDASQNSRFPLFIDLF